MFGESTNPNPLAGAGGKSQFGSGGKNEPTMVSNASTTPLGGQNKNPIGNTGPLSSLPLGGVPLGATATNAIKQEAKGSLFGTTSLFGATNKK